MALRRTSTITLIDKLYASHQKLLTKKQQVYILYTDTVKLQVPLHSKMCVVPDV